MGVVVVEGGGVGFARDLEGFCGEELGWRFGGRLLRERKGGGFGDRGGAGFGKSLGFA